MGSGGVAIAALPTVICLKVSFSDGLGGGKISLLIFLGVNEIFGKFVAEKKIYISCLTYI